MCRFGISAVAASKQAPFAPLPFCSGSQFFKFLGLRHRAVAASKQAPFCLGSQSELVLQIIALLPDFSKRPIMYDRRTINVPYTLYDVPYTLYDVP